MIVIHFLSAQKELKISVFFKINNALAKNFALVEIKKIPSRVFWAHEKNQSAKIYRPEFLDKNNHVISWNKDLLSQVTEAASGGVLWKKLFLKILQ